MTRLIDRIWERDGLGAAALTPLSWLFGVAAGARNLAYDRGVLSSHALGLPAVSVGNLSVGGTGKTPVAAWVAQELTRRGATPAILLRGHGDDEPLVHERLTPGVIVVADPDRVAGAHRALGAGATVLVLDDAFQHRRARRDLDIVLVAAEQGMARRLLPAGPLREGARALRRAQLLVVTRKTASAADAVDTAARWSAASPGLPSVRVHLAADALLPVTADLPTAGAGALAALAGRRVLAISAIGAPAAFEGQLRSAGAKVESAAYPDHHAFTDVQIAELALRATRADIAVCTLKDAVKLEGRWPRQAPPLWYVSQLVVIEQGERILANLLDRLVRPVPSVT